MKKVIEYLQRLSKHNNREWFNAHKDEYLEAKSTFDTFAAQLIDGIREFDSSIDNLAVKDCTYRIYRDTRFSADKTPYKTHFGVFVVPGGKKSGFSGYYLQVGAFDSGFPGGCILATGDYCCDPKVLNMIREDITFDEGHEFMRALSEAVDFELDFSNALKRPAKGFPNDKPYSEYLRLRNFCLVRYTGTAYMQAPMLLERALKDLATTKSFLDFINRPVAHLLEERQQEQPHIYLRQ